MSEIPDIEVARYALRTFKFDSGRLMPIAVPVDAWKGGVCEAACLRDQWHPYGPMLSLFGIEFDALDRPRDHEAPADNCDCGIYGCLTIERLKQQYPFECMDLVTVIAVEGNTIIGDVGLRTQAARVVAYWSPKKGVRRICADTCDTATEFTSLNDMLAAFGFDPERKAGWPLLDDPRSVRHRLTRFGRILFGANVGLVVVNLTYFIVGLFTSADMSHQMSNLGAAALSGVCVVLIRHNWRKRGLL